MRARHAPNGGVQPAHGHPGRIGQDSRSADSKTPAGKITQAKSPTHYLSFDKTRWLTGTAQRNPMIIGLVGDTAGFERLHDESNARQLEREISGLLEDGKWRTTEGLRTELRIRKTTVMETLRANRHLFRSEAGSLHNRDSKAIVWQLADTGTAAVVELFPQPARKGAAIRRPDRPTGAAPCPGTVDSGDGRSVSSRCLFPPRLLSVRTVPREQTIPGRPRITPTGREQQANTALVRRPRTPPAAAAHIHRKTAHGPATPSRGRTEHHRRYRARGRG